MNTHDTHAATGEPGRSDPLARLTTAQRTELAHASRAARNVGVVVPAILTLIGVVVTLAWLPRMPDPAVTHWGISGPDGTGAPWTNVALSAGLGIGLLALNLLQRGPSRATPGAAVWTSMHRLLPALVLATVAFVQVIAVGATWVQLDVKTAADAGPIDGIVALAFGGALATGALGYAVQPKLRIEGAAAEVAAPLVLAADERAVWFGEVRPSRVLIWGAGTAVTVLIVTAILMLITSVPVWWIIALVAVLLLGLFACTMRFRVRIDRSGLEARSVVGWPVFRVPAAEVAQAEVTQVNPLAEWGGWGMRQAPGRFGLILREGEAIEIVRDNGRRFVLTVDDAGAGASLLMALAGSGGERDAKRGKKS